MKGLRLWLGTTATLLVLVSGLFLLGDVAQPQAETQMRLAALSRVAPPVDQGDWAPEVLTVSPLTVSLATAASTVSQDAGLYELWLAGKADLDEELTIADAQSVGRWRQSSHSLAETGLVQTTSSAAASSRPQLYRQFESLDILECCSGGAVVPPDPDIAVGSDHVVVAVNIAFEIYHKSGQVLIPAVRFASLFAGVTGCQNSAELFDPNVLYDESAGRFIMGIDSGGRLYCVAVSATSDPTGVWRLYAIPTNVGGLFFDYPQAGVGRDAIYVGANMFNCTLTPCRFDSARVWALDKAAMYSGDLAAIASLSLGPDEDTPQPAHLHGFDQGTWPTTGPQYILTETGFNTGAPVYSVFAWRDPFEHLPANLSKVGAFDLAAYTGIPTSFPIPVPQPGGGQLLEANDWRLQDAEYRNGSVWTTDTIACNVGGEIVDCIRWAQIDPASAAILQAGVYGSADAYRFFGDLAVSHRGHMLIGYTRVVPGDATSGYPGVWVAGRRAQDPANQLGQEAAVRVSTSPYMSAFSPTPAGAQRWGDYTGMASDPNGTDFWYVGQYSKANVFSAANWGTYVGCLRFPPDATTAEKVTTTQVGLEVRAYLPFIRTVFLPCR